MLDAPAPTQARGRPALSYDDDRDHHVEEKPYDQPHEHPARPAALSDPRENNAPQEWADRTCRAHEHYGPCRYLQNDMFSDDYMKLVEQAAAAAAPVVEA